MRIRGYTCVAALMLSTSGLLVAEEASVDQARDAPAKKNDDADSAKALEEVFQAAEKNYTLLEKDGRTLTYSFNYALVRDQWLTLVPLTKASGDTQIYGLAGRQSQSQHTFTNSFTFDCGIWDSLTSSLCLSPVTKYGTEMDTYVYSLGDVFVTLRRQPWVAVHGRLATTLYITIGPPAGDNPYKINLDRDISIGDNYYSLGFGANMSYMIDPVVLYGSPSHTWDPLVDDVHQILANNSQLEEVSPGNTINFNMGMAHALSCDVSLATSYQMAYTLKDRYHITADMFEPSEQTSSIMNFLLGLWTSSDYIVNVNAGFGLTEDSPDVLLGLSVPLDIKGLKAQ